MKRSIKTEHSGAKNRGGYWGLRTEAKRRSKKLRRHYDKLETAAPTAKLKVNPKP